MPPAEETSPIEHLTKNILARIVTVVTAIATIVTALHQLTRDIFLTVEGLTLVLVLIATGFIVFWRVKKKQNDKDASVFFYARVPRLIAGAAFIVAALFAMAYTAQVANIVIERERLERQLVAVPIAPTPNPTVAIVSTGATRTIAPEANVTAQPTTLISAITATPVPLSGVAPADLAKIQSAIQNAKPVYRTAEGILDKPDSLRFPRALYAKQNLKNFSVNAQVFNPSDAAVQPWDYGFGFRRLDAGEYPLQYQIYVNSDGTWTFRMLTGEIDTKTQVGTSRVLESGKLKNLNVAPNGSNLLRLIAQEKTGYFFVNGEFVTTLDLSLRNEPGDIYLATGFVLSAHNFQGLRAAFKDFTIFSLP